MENWKPVIGYETHYLVSNLGRIMNIAVGTRRQIGYIHAGTIGKHGYVHIQLTKDKITKMCKLHRIVAESFIQNPLEKKTVNHKDGNKINNLVSNLEWNTQSENVQHSYSTGLRHGNIGISNGRATMTELQAINIMHCKGSISIKSLSELLNIPRGTIGAIWSGQNWNYLFQKQNSIIGSK